MCDGFSSSEKDELDDGQDGMKVHDTPVFVFS